MKRFIYLMKLNKKLKSLFYHFSHLEKEQIYEKLFFCALSKENLKSTGTWWKYAIITILKTCVPEFLTRPTFKGDGLYL